MDAIIRSAIANRTVLEFRYRGGLPRVAEPHVYGLIGGKAQMLMYQLRGESSSGNLPQWRRFELSQVSDLHAIGETFVGPRPSSGQHSSFETILAVVK